LVEKNQILHKKPILELIILNEKLLISKSMPLKYLFKKWLVELGKIGNRNFILMDKRLLNITELSEYLRLTKGTLYVWVCHKKIPYLKVGSSLRFDLTQIDNWLKGRRVAEMT